RVAAGLGISSDAAVYDISNACLGVLNGIVDIANRIELRQCRAGLVVSCETAREINEAMIEQMLAAQSIEAFRTAVATLTGGSGAAAVLVTDGSFSSARKRKLLGGVTKNAPEFHALCKWGLQTIPAVFQQLWALDAAAFIRYGMELGIKHCVMPFMATDAGAVLKYGVDLGLRTWKAFTTKLGWAREQIDKIICHQVGAGHRAAILQTLGIPPEKDFSTYEYLGNIGTVS